MAEKDRIEKVFFQHPDVFADVFNGNVFGGREAIDPSKLTASETESQFSDHQGKHHTQYRDLLMEYNESKQTLALFGIENQSKIDRMMPVRVLNYNITSYAKQASSGAKKLYPVMTIVLYFGQKKWNASRQLEDLFDLERYPELKRYMPSMEIKVVDVAHMEEAELEKLKSDFKHVAQYLTKRSRNEAYEPEETAFQHFDDFMDLISELDHEGVDEFQEWVETNGSDEVKDKMMNFIDRAEARGRAEERTEARKEGLANLIIVLNESGFEENQVFEKAKARYGKYFSDEEIKRFIEERKLGA